MDRFRIDGSQKLVHCRCWWLDRVWMVRVHPSDGREVWMHPAVQHQLCGVGLLDGWEGRDTHRWIQSGFFHRRWRRWRRWCQQSRLFFHLRLPASCTVIPRPEEFLTNTRNQGHFSSSGFSWTRMDNFSVNNNNNNNKMRNAESTCGKSLDVFTPRRWPRQCCTPAPAASFFNWWLVEGQEEGPNHWEWKGGTKTFYAPPLCLRPLFLFFSPSSAFDRPFTSPNCKPLQQPFFFIKGHLLYWKSQSIPKHPKASQRSLKKKKIL